MLGHEEGVEEFEVEVKKIADGWAPPPAVNILCLAHNLATAGRKQGNPFSFVGKPAMKACDPDGATAHPARTPSCRDGARVQDDANNTADEAGATRDLLAAGRLAFPHSIVKEEDGTEANETNDESAFQASR